MDRRFPTLAKSFCAQRFAHELTPSARGSQHSACLHASPKWVTVPFYWPKNMFKLEKRFRYHKSLNRSRYWNRWSVDSNNCQAWYDKPVVYCILIVRECILRLNKAPVPSPQRQAGNDTRQRALADTCCHVLSHHMLLHALTRSRVVSHACTCCHMLAHSLTKTRHSSR